MARRMEAALEHVAHAAQLVAVAAHSGAVRRWDASGLARAFHWARYCERLCSQFRNNATMRRDAEAQLLHTNGSLRAVFPAYEAVSLSDLSRCRHLLLLGLMNNPELPADLLKLLFDTESPGLFPQNESAGLCGRIIQCKSACKVLRVFPDSSPCGADAEVLGPALMQRLGALLTPGSDVRPAEQFLDSLLQGSEGAAGRFYPVVAAALLTAPESQTQTASQNVLLGWLQKQQSGLQHMCSTLPTTLLAELAKAHGEFRDAYQAALRCWASALEYGADGGEWVHTSQAVSFQRLIEHFRALFEVQPSLRDAVEQELKALKRSDGDFNARGLSVWGDLLSALGRGTIS